jgi:hypothetical protein
MLLDRRRMLLATLAAPCLGVAPARATGPAAQEFLVTRNGAPIGHHRLAFRTDGPRLVVEIDIELEVKLAFLTLYRYRHTNRELWEGERLLGFTSRTDDNGTAHRVEARRVRERIRVESGLGRIEAPGDTPPTGWWHRRLLGQGRWIDTQSGRLVTAAVTAKGMERVPALGRTIEADRFALQGDLALELWYAGERWVKLAFAGPDGSAIDYRLVRGERLPITAAA